MFQLGQQFSGLLIVIAMLPLFFVGAAGGAGFAMFFIEDASPLLGAALVAGALLISGWVSRTFYDKMTFLAHAGDAAEEESGFWTRSTARVWFFASLAVPLAGAIVVVLALIS